MKGDFSRVSFDPRKHFTQVLQQQGRVQLDADWNEQTAIFLHYYRSLAADLIGPHGGPADERNSDGMVQKRNLGFAIVTDASNFNETSDVERERLAKLLGDGDKNGPLLIGKGRYYVNGLLAEVDDYYSLYQQPDYPWPPGEKLQPGRYLIYLDVWERHLTHLDDTSIREVALEGADTTTRAKLVWQVKAIPLTEDLEGDRNVLPALEQKLSPANRGQLKVRAKYEGKSEPCISSPQASYRGLENQLYRVELFSEGNNTWFKWSRDNASTVATANFIDNLVKVDDARGFAVGQLVELTNNEQELRGRAGPLYKIKKIEGNELFLDTPAFVIPTNPNENSPTLARRWDGAQKIKESTSDNEWQTLGDGIQVQFQSLTEENNKYRTGDYWLIPVRTATGDVEWPSNEALPPQGIHHYYAPLAIVDIASTTAQPQLVRDLRRHFQSLAQDVDMPN